MIRFSPNYVLTSSPGDFSIIENYSCAPMIVEFVDSSSDALTWNWDFGDGSVLLSKTITRV